MDGREITKELEALAASLNEVDTRSARRLRDLASSLATERGRQRWADVDLRRAFHTDRLSHAYALRREGGYAPASVEVADKIRNVLVLLPILLTWAALAEAVRAYNRFLTENPEEQGTPFLLLWQRGFGGEAGLLSPTFSTVAILDAIVIGVIIALTFYTHGRREKQEDIISDTTAEFQAEIDNALAEATVLLAADRASRPMLLTDSVERLADRFERSSQELLTQLQIEHDRLDVIATQREQEFRDIGLFASGMRSGAEEMHHLLVDLRQVSNGLESALQDLTSEVSVSSDQQRSLLTAVATLERLTSSAIQSDQAVTRQLSTAVVNLAETADRAISGADAAAQAGRVASDAVRGISELAQQIADSQRKVEQTLSSELDARGQLADALRATTSGSQLTARTLNDVGASLLKIKEEFDRLSSQAGQQANALNALLAQQADIARDISQVARELGSVGLSTAQRQREVNQDFQHLVQRLDGLANTLNRMSQQTPSVENLQHALTNAIRGELARSGRS
jgi:chromosome segregation ATPase